MHGLGKYCNGEHDIVGSLNWDNSGYANVDEIDEKGNLFTHKFEDYGRNLYDEDGNRIFVDNHVRPHKIKEYVGDEIWNSYFKVTSIRNPWDRCVSAYCFDNKQKKLKNSLETYINNDGNHNMFFDNEGTPLADFYIRYENLQSDYDCVCKRIGVPQNELPKLRTTFRNPEERDYKKFYETSKQIDAVRKSHKHDIEYFGYEFDQTTPHKKLVCIYTQLKDADKLEKFKKSSLYSKMISNPNMKVVEVYAGSPQTKNSDGKLFLSCEEEYSKLSVKTYEMLKYCANNFDFDHLVKIDSTIIDYKDNLLPEHMSEFYYDTSRIDTLLYSNDYSDVPHYFGSCLLANGSCQNFDKWAAHKNMKINYYEEFPDGPPAYYTGKFYVMSNEFVKYVAKSGKQLANRHVKNMGGSEDTFIGRMFTKFHGSKWQYQTPWKQDLRNTTALMRTRIKV
tara:strand:- start:449 stop:1795 length:1347 start_codon:yes stop_codon:yes gene_type:complete